MNVDMLLGLVKRIEALEKRLADVEWLLLQTRLDLYGEPKHDPPQ